MRWLFSHHICSFKTKCSCSAPFLHFLRGCTWFASIRSTPGTPMETTCICAVTQTCACCPGSKSSSQCHPVSHVHMILLAAVTWSGIFYPLHSKFDLYTKTTDLPDVDELKQYYQSLIDKYCPGTLKWWNRQCRNTFVRDQLIQSTTYVQKLWLTYRCFIMINLTIFQSKKNPNRIISIFLILML